jgi:(1->4)-alpha-D-glucan 1-alpha-D-glucosylmutase
LQRFIARVLDERLNPRFLADFRAFQKRIAHLGAFNGLSQTLLKIASPGAPDTYQGTELWDFCLVDPDNRRPVDYAGRRAALAASGAMSHAELLARWRDGRIKLHVIERALNVRRRLPELFAAGDYQPLEASGLHAERVVAVLRKHGGEACIGVVPRLAWPLLGDREEPLPCGWGDTRLAVPSEAAGAGTWFDGLSGAEVFVPPDGRLDVARLLGGFPVALLVNAPDAAQPG